MMASDTSRLPVFFVGHGNPMYGIEENRFTEGWRASVADVALPEAIVVVSAHWETTGSKVTAMAHPRVIHDFYGFPQELFEARYDAPGSPELARRISESVDGEIECDFSWGLDHGAWTVLKKMFPAASIPVLQISLDRGKPPSEHLELAKRLKWLRTSDVLVIASGNMVHNLRFADFGNPPPAAWAVSADEKFKNAILEHATERLTDYPSLGEDVRLAIPTPEHFLPLLYAVGMTEPDERVTIFNEGVDLASISMTSVRWG